jgi:hypothetical protein
VPVRAIAVLTLKFLPGTGFEASNCPWPKYPRSGWRSLRGTAFARLFDAARGLLDGSAKNSPFPNYNFGANALPARAIVCFSEIGIMAASGSGSPICPIEWRTVRKYDDDVAEL